MKLTTEQTQLLAQLNRLRRQHPNPEAPVQERMEFIVAKAQKMAELMTAIAAAQHSSTI